MNLNASTRVQHTLRIRRFGRDNLCRVSDHSSSFRAAGMSRVTREVRFGTQIRLAALSSGWWTGLTEQQLVPRL